MLDQLNLYVGFSACMHDCNAGDKVADRGTQGMEEGSSEVDLLCFIYQCYAIPLASTGLFS